MDRNTLPFLVSHATGNANVRQAVSALDEAGLLAEFHTAIAWKKNSWADRTLPHSLTSELRRRSFDTIPADKIVAHPLHEIARLAANKLPRRISSRLPHSWLSVDGVYQSLDRAVASAVRTSEGLGGIYAYEDGAEYSFEAAAEQGLERIYDLPIGYWRFYHRLMAEERELRPEWAGTLGGSKDGPAKLARKDAELALASRILVASSFTASTLAEYPQPLSAPVHIIRYGAPPSGPARTPSQPGAPLKILYVGSIGQRKGVSYLLEAVDKLGVPHTLTMLGRPVARPPVLEAAFAKHRWIASAPHSEVLQLMREHDVLVFPSLFEGFGLVILEAMAQGCVVIATPHTAGPDLFDNGRDGILVPIRDADAIAAALTQLSEDRNLLHSMSQAAQQKAISCTWESYRRGVVEALTVS